MPPNLYFLNHEEFLETRNAFLADVGRSKKVSLENLETYLQEYYGRGFDVCQPREPCNSDCIIRMKSNNTEFSAAQWIISVLRIHDLKGCNKSCLFALKWMYKKSNWEIFFMAPKKFRPGMFEYKSSECYYTGEQI